MENNDRTILVDKVAQFIRKECTNNGISTSEFARRCGNKITADYINKIKQKVPKSISLDVLDAIATGAGISLRQLLEELGVIEKAEHEILSMEDAKMIIQGLRPFLSEFIALEKMTSAERYELACKIYDIIKILSYKYK